MTGSMLELPERVYELQKHGHDVFLHCDFIQGLNTNTEGSTFVYSRRYRSTKVLFQQKDRQFEMPIKLD